MIKFAHEHEDGKTCVMSNKPYKSMATYNIGGKEFYAGYRSYTGHYYIFDTKGQEVATVDKNFFELLMPKFKTGDLTPNPNCKP